MQREVEHIWFLLTTLLFSKPFQQAFAMCLIKNARDTLVGVRAEQSRVWPASFALEKCFDWCSFNKLWTIGTLPASHFNTILGPDQALLWNVMQDPQAAAGSKAGMHQLSVI